MLIAESFGGADEPVDVLLQALVSTEAVMLDSPLRVKQTPELQLYQQFEEAGVCLCVCVCVPPRVTGARAAAGAMIVGGRSVYVGACACLAVCVCVCVCLRVLDT